MFEARSYHKMEIIFHALAAPQYKRFEPVLY